MFVSYQVVPVAILLAALGCTVAEAKSTLQDSPVTRTALAQMLATQQG